MDGRHILGTTNCFRTLEEVEDAKKAVSESSDPLLKSSDCCPLLSKDTLLCGNRLAVSVLLLQDGNGVLGGVCSVALDCSLAYKR